MTFRPRPNKPWSFNASVHSYAFDGETVPSVTDICDTIPIGYGERAAERGQAIHHATLALDLDAYHPDDYPDFVDPHIVVYKEFLAAHRCRWTRLEQPRVSPAGFGGTADRLGRIDGLEAILDIKSGARADWHAWQTAGYDLLHDDLPPRIRRRVALYLSPTRWRYLTHFNRGDYAVFIERARDQGVRI